MTCYQKEPQVTIDERSRLAIYVAYLWAYSLHCLYLAYRPTCTATDVLHVRGERTSYGRQVINHLLLSVRLSLSLSLYL